MYRLRKISKKIGFFKLKYKLIYILSLVILAISAFFYIFFTKQFEAQAVKSLHEKGDFISQYIIDKLQNNLSKGEKTFNNDLVQVFDKYSIDYCILTNNKGLVNKAYNLKLAEQNLYLFTLKGEQLTEDKNIFRTKVPIAAGDSQVVAYIGFSAKNYREYIFNVRKNAGIISLIIFITGTLLIFIISSLVTKPINKLFEGSELYNKGNLRHKISYFKENQIGAIAKALNYLSFNLDSANEKVENLNKQLKGLFRDRIGELNLEINQRRIAEYSLKQSEKQFRLLFERAPIGMVISTPDDKILQVNNAFCQSLGYTENELSNRKTSDLTYLDDQPHYIKLLNQLLDEDLSHIYFENRFIRKDREIIYTIVESVLIRGENEKPHHFVSQVIDITERKKVEKELVKAKEKAEESDRLKTAFLAQMSHEIRTPLNVILAATPILADELPEGNDDNDILLDSMTNAGKRLQRTIDMILNMSSVQSGNYVPDIEEVDLNKELKKLLEEFRSLTGNKNLNLNFYNKSSDPIIIADKYTLNQIFQNLIGNAVKYTLDGEIAVSLYEKDKYNICAEIKDSGIGISQEYMTKLFTPFSQEDSGHTRKFEGNGLGLALVKKYVELNNAEITVESEKNIGTVFTLTFKNLLWHEINKNNLISKTAF